MLDGHKNSFSVKVDELLMQMRRSGCLPALNDNVQNICKLVNDSQTCASDLSAIIMRDCGLTSNLLVTVNSPLYAAKQPIKTVSAAVVYLGFDKIYQLALGLSIFKQNMNSDFDAILFRLYASSYFAGLMSMTLAREAKANNSEELFVAGLLHHLPRLGLAYAFPEKYHEMEMMMSKLNFSENLACRKVFDVDYDDICRGVCEIYHVPGKVEELLRNREARDPMLSLVREAGNIATMIFGDKATGKEHLNELETRLRTVLHNQKFLIGDFIRNSCSQDNNIVRFFKLNKDDIDMMVSVLEWGKASPGQVMVKFGMGEGLEEKEPVRENFDTMFNQYLLDLFSARRNDVDVNQILMLAQETLFQSFGRPVVFTAFIDHQKFLRGRFYAGNNLLLKANDFFIDMKKESSPLIECLKGWRAQRWENGQSPLLLSEIFTKRSKMVYAIFAPIIVSRIPIGLYFIARSEGLPFSDKEESWLAQVVENVELTFERVRSAAGNPQQKTA